MPRGKGSLIFDFVIRDRATEVLKRIAGDAEESFAQLAARFGAGLAIAGQQFVETIREGLAELREFDRDYRVAQGKAFLTDEENQSISRLLSSGQAEEDIAAGLSGIRRFGEFEVGTAEYDNVALTLARLNAAGVNTDAYSKLIRRENPGGITAQDFVSTSELFYSIPTSQGSDPGNIINQVLAVAPHLAGFGLDSTQMLQMAVEADLAGFDISEWESVFAHGKDKAGAAGFDPATYWSTALAELSQAGSAEEATRIATAAFGGGLNKPAVATFSEFFFGSGGFSPGAAIDPAILGEAGLVATHATPEERLAASLQADVRRGGWNEFGAY